MVDKDGICGNYSAFVLRVWREPGSGQLRGTLKNTQSGRRESFVSLPALLDRLLAQSAASVTESQPVATFTSISK